jgi:hypothetical protein
MDINLDTQHVATHAGSGMIGAVVAWFTLREKINRVVVIQENMDKAVAEIKEAMHDQAKAVVYIDTCTECKARKNEQYQALNDKLDILLERRGISR